MKTKLKKKNKVSLALYVAAVLFGIYAIFSLINTALYISNLISTQYITVAESLTDIIVYFVTNCGPYIFYAAALGGLGYLAGVTAGLREDKKALDEDQSSEAVNEPAEMILEPGLSPAAETASEETAVEEAAPEENDSEDPKEQDAPDETDSEPEEGADKKE